MINPKKLGAFLAKMMASLIPVLGVMFMLTLISGLFIGEEEPLSLARSWRFWVLAFVSMIPSMAAIIAAYLLASRFVQELYGLQSLYDGRQFVERVLFGLRAFSPWYRVASAKIEADETHVLNRIGGPGNVVVFNDSAVLLQQAGRMTRVADKGYVSLEPFERVFATVDLRPKRWVVPVRAQSREGIPVTCEVDLSYQIDGEDKVPSRELPFPASKEKIFRAATATWVQGSTGAGQERTMDWSARVALGLATGNLRSLIADYPLDRLIGMGEPRSLNVRTEIRNRLEERVKSAASDLGVRLSGLELGDIQVEDKITQQWIKAWKAKWEREVVERRTLGRARQAEDVERARNAAQVALLRSINAAFQPLLAEQQDVTASLVLTRLFMALAAGPDDPLTRVNLPRESVATLKMLKEMIE